MYCLIAHVPRDVLSHASCVVYRYTPSSKPICIGHTNKMCKKHLQKKKKKIEACVCEIFWPAYAMYMMYTPEKHSDALY